MSLHKNWIKKFHNNRGILLSEKYLGLLWWRKRYYHGWSQNVHNLHSQNFLIEADWFDTLTPDEQYILYRRVKWDAHNRSLVIGGHPELASRCFKKP